MRKTGPQIKETIKEYKDTLQKLGIDVGRIILYGSFARGNQREGSDIDLLIISDDFQKMNLRERLEVLGVAAARIMEPVEAIGYTPEEIKSVPQASFLKEVLKVGIAI